MKLAISNIAWPNEEFDEYIRLVSDLGIEGLELAPSCVWPEPVEASLGQRRSLRVKVEDQGLSVVGIHSLLFTRPDLQLFADEKSRRKTGDYLKSLFELTADLGGRTLVFGSPKNRTLQGRSHSEAKELALDFFREIGSDAEKFGVVLCMEALSPIETDFIQSTQDAVDMVDRVGSKGFGLHIDAKAMMECNEDIQETLIPLAGRIEHFHISDSGLKAPGSSGFDHSIFGNVLKKSSYDRFVSIEMRRTDDSRKNIIQAVDYVRGCYPVKSRV